MAKFTKGQYKKNLRERKRTSALLKKQMPKASNRLTLSSEMPYGSLKGKTIKEIMDGHWRYFNAMSSDTSFASDVRAYEKVLRGRL